MFCFDKNNIDIVIKNTILRIYAFLSSGAEAIHGMNFSFRYHQPRMLHKIFLFL